jgi:hypothetical protein
VRPELPLAIAAAGVVGAATTAAASTAGWIPISFAAVSAVVGTWLTLELRRGQR